MRLILLLILSLMIVNADKVIDHQFKNGETFELEGVTYEIRYVEDKDFDVMQIVSNFGKIVLSENECDQYGQYKFCFDRFVPLMGGIESDNPALMRDKVAIRVNRVDCEAECLSGIADACQTNEDCELPYCVHGVCSSAPEVCGDGYCDKDEACPEDCSYTVTNASEFAVPSTLDWIEIPVTNGTYTFKTRGAYRLNESYPNVTAAGIGRRGGPCENLPEGALVAKLCDRCMLVNETIEVQGCQLTMRVNELRLFDNHGNLTVIMQQDIQQEEEPVLTTNVTETDTEHIERTYILDLIILLSVTIGFIVVLIVLLKRKSSED
ncbi:MAG: hypothetical protein ACQESG_03600 [Nanobdellota archaeon]